MKQDYDAESFAGWTEEPGISRRFVLMADALPVLISYVGADRARERHRSRVGGTGGPYNLIASLAASLDLSYYLSPFAVL
ncbi:MAG: hypothetical protein J5J00_01150 [Deltaproteobacteria bacterium]|nr:hypothetical protein [Deltaproteobacteria bacterium]